MIKATFYFTIYFLVFLITLVGFGFYGFYSLLGVEFMSALLVVFVLSIITIVILYIKSYKVIKDTLVIYIDKIKAYIESVLNKIPKPVLKMLLKILGIKK